MLGPIPIMGASISGRTIRTAAWPVGPRRSRNPRARLMTLGLSPHLVRIRRAIERGDCNLLKD